MTKETMENTNAMGKVLNATVLEDFRRQIEAAVELRLRLIEFRKRLRKGGEEVQLPLEVLDEAIDNLYLAEGNMGNAHHHMLVASATISHERNKTQRNR